MTNNNKLEIQLIRLGLFDDMGLLFPITKLSKTLSKLFEHVKKIKSLQNGSFGIMTHPLNAL